MRVAVFASQSGTNAQALMDADAAGTLKATVALCVTNNPAAPVLERARAHGVPSVVLDPHTYAQLTDYVEALHAELDEAAVDFIALAGYLRKIPEATVDAYRHRMLNIHPSLLPAFGGPGMYGRRVHAAVLAHGVRWTGVTVHLVEEAYDSGPIVLQQPVPVEPGDTVETLAARVLAVEHTVYPQAVRLFAEGRVRVDGRQVHVLDAPLSG